MKKLLTAIFILSLTFGYGQKTETKFYLLAVESKDHQLLFKQDYGGKIHILSKRISRKSAKKIIRQIKAAYPNWFKKVDTTDSVFKNVHHHYNIIYTLRN